MLKTIDSLTWFGKQSKYKRRRAAEQSPITHADAECCLSSRDRSVVRLRPRADGHKPWPVPRAHLRNRQTPRAQTRYPRTTSLGLVLPTRPPSRQPSTDDDTRPIEQLSATLGLSVGRNFAPLARGFQPVLVRESNPRQPDYRSGALSTELTGGGTDLAFVRTHVRNTQRQPFARGVARRWPSDVKSLLQKRRRWESNPLQTALQAVA